MARKNNTDKPKLPIAIAKQIRLKTSTKPDIVVGKDVATIATMPATANLTGLDVGITITDIPPLVLARSPRSRLFSPGRPGRPVVRPTDLLALRIELINLYIQAGAPPMLTRAESGTVLIILHFPPQAIAEEVFFETAPAGMNTPDLPPGAVAKPDLQDNGVAPPPIRARGR